MRLVRQSDVDTFKANQTSIVYASDGSVISTLKGEKDSYYVSIEEMPVDAVTAIVSTEDKKFFRHHGIDYRALLRAVKAMVQNGEVKQGGSTITMQLARNIFLSQEKTWQRKVEEMYIATELENKYSKDQILEFYLNNIILETDITGSSLRREDISTVMWKVFLCPRLLFCVQFRTARHTMTR